MNDSPPPVQSPDIASGAEQTKPQKRHSWKKSLLTSVLVGIIILFAGIAIVATGAVKDEERFGYGLGRLAFVSMLIAYIVSYLRQTGRKAPAWGVTIVFVLLLGASIVAATMRMQNPQVPLTDEETQCLVADGTGASRSLFHPHLGFRVDHPGPSFSELSESMMHEMIELMGDIDGPTHGYGYEDPVTGSVFFVMLVKGVNEGPECDSFLDRLRGVRASGVEVQEISSEPGTAALFDIRMPDGQVRFGARCTRLGPERLPFYVALSFSSDTDTDLAQIVSSFRVEGELGD